MITRSLTFLSYAAILSIGGAAGGWVITSRMAGSNAGIYFLQFAGLIELIIFATLIVLYKRAERRVIHLILFNITLFINLIWFTSCLFLPIFWMSSIGIGMKWCILILAICLYCANAAKGMRAFDIKWQRVGSDLMRRFYDRENNILDWNGVMRSLKLVVSLYIPGVPEKLSSILSVLSVASMLSGFALRNVFPVYSVFAWGVPVIVINSLFIQMIGFGISQIRMLSAMEKKGSVELRPV